MALTGHIEEPVRAIDKDAFSEGVCFRSFDMYNPSVFSQWLCRYVVGWTYNGTTSQWGAVYPELCKKPKAKADAAQNIVLSNLFA